MSRLLKRTEIMTFLNVTPTENTKKWALVGNGATSGSYTYETEETNETYIVNDSPTTTIDNYSIALDTEMKCILGDEVFDYVDQLRYNLAVGTDAETQVLLIDKYKVTDGKFRAQEFNCSIGISSFGGDGGKTPTIAFKINVNGNPTNGTVAMTNGEPVFTPTVEVN